MTYKKTRNILKKAQKEKQHLTDIFAVTSVFSE